MEGTRRIRFINCHKMYRNLRNAPGRQRISAQSAIGAVYQRFVERGSQKSPVYHKNPPSCTMPQSCIHPPKTWNNATPKPILREWKNERMKEWKSERMKEWKNERMKDWDEAIDPHRQIITYFSQSQQQWINSNQWNEWRKWCPIPQPLWSISWWNHSMISVTIWLNPSTKVGHLLLPPSAISFPPKRNSNQMRLNH